MHLTMRSMITLPCIVVAPHALHCEDIDRFAVQHQDCQAWCRCFCQIMDPCLICGHLPMLQMVPSIKQASRYIVLAACSTITQPSAHVIYQAWLQPCALHNLRISIRQLLMMTAAGVCHMTSEDHPCSTTVCCSKRSTVYLAQTRKRQLQSSRSTW